MVKHPDEGQEFYLVINDEDKEKFLVGIYKVVATSRRFYPHLKKIYFEYTNDNSVALFPDSETMMFDVDLKFIAKTLEEAKKNLIRRLFIGPFDVQP